MPKLEKTLKGDLAEIEKKINFALSVYVPLLTKRDSWTTTVGDVKCVVHVYEKHAKRIWNEAKEEWQPQPHYSLTLTLVDTGEEVRLCGITAGSAQDMYFLTDCGGEGALLDALKTTMELFDQIIVP